MAWFQATSPPTDLTTYWASSLYCRSMKRMASGATPHPFYERISNRNRYATTDVSDLPRVQ